MLRAMHPVAHLLCDVPAVLLEGLPGTSSLCDMVDGFPAIISLLLPSALQLVLCPQSGSTWLFFCPSRVSLAVVS